VRRGLILTKFPRAAWSSSLWLEGLAIRIENYLAFFSLSAPTDPHQRVFVVRPDTALVTKLRRRVNVIEAQGMKEQGFLQYAKSRLQTVHDKRWSRVDGK
jgi:hypothetical protein